MDDESNVIGAARFCLMLAGRFDFSTKFPYELLYYERNRIA